MTKDREHVIGVINAERDYQNMKWGTIKDHPHEVGSWLTIIRTLLTKAELEYTSKRGDQGALDELRKVAATAMACMEQHGAVSRKVIDFAEQSGNFVTYKKDRE